MNDELATSVTEEKTEGVETAPEPKPEEKQLPVYIREWKIIAGVLVFAAAAVGIYFYRNSQVAARVNGQVITRRELRDFLERQAGKKALDNLITDALIRQEARKNNVAATDAELDEEYAKAVQRVEAGGQTMEAFLASEGATAAYLRGRLRYQILVRKLTAGLAAVSDEEVDAYIAENKKSFPVEIDTSSAEFKSQLKNELLNQKLAGAVASWIADLRGKADITIPNRP